MSQRFTVTAFSKSDGERGGADIQGEVNQLFEGDEPTPSSSDKGGASSLSEDALKGLKAPSTNYSASMSAQMEETCTRRAPVVA
ncbi:hypothetical protein AOLI_G00011820 [Acnodon oligacanthus]